MNEPSIDLTGKLIIKVALGDDIRRILITNEDITYDELVLMMQRVYRGKLNSTDDIVIKYKDEDNDLITIFDSSDLSFAIQCSRILKITLFVNSKPEPLQTDEIKMIKNELKHIRDQCTKLLDRLDDREVLEFPSSTVDTTSNTSKGNITDSPRRAAAPSPRMPPPTAAGSKEFDPLSTQRSIEDQQDKVMSSFGVTSSDRAGTPDSISSIGSAGQRPPGQVTPQPPPQQITPQAPPHTAPQAPPQQTQQPQQPPHQVPATSMYGGSSGPQKMTPWQQPQNQQQNATGQPSQYPGQQQQQQGFPQTSQQQQGYPGQQPPSSQPQSLPNSTAGPSYGPGGYGGYGGQPQHGQYPGPHPGQAAGQGQMGHPSQQQQQQQPQSYYQQQPQQPGTPGQAPPPGGNPYARQGPGYGSGYPRPAASYPQGYQ